METVTTTIVWSLRSGERRGGHWKHRRLCSIARLPALVPIGYQVEVLPGLFMVVVKATIRPTNACTLFGHSGPEYERDDGTVRMADAFNDRPMRHRPVYLYVGNPEADILRQEDEARREKAWAKRGAAINEQEAKYRELVETLVSAGWVPYTGPGSVYSVGHVPEETSGTEAKEVRPLRGGL
jgi:hypothetical protein